MRQMRNFNYLEQIAMVIAIGILLWGLSSALQLPIYPDEVAYRIFLERFFINGGFKQSVTPYCTEGFMVAPPCITSPLICIMGGIKLISRGVLVIPLCSLPLLVCYFDNFICLWPSP